VPEEMLRRAGFELISVYELAHTGFQDTNLSGNPCSFIKLCSGINYSEYDGIIFTNCCNSTQRLYDYVKYHYPYLFTYLLELPRSKEDIWNCNMLIMNLCEFFHMQPEAFFQKKYNAGENSCELKAAEGTKAFSVKRGKSGLDGRNDLAIITSCLSKEYAKELTAIFPEYKYSLSACFNEDRGESYLLGERKVSCPRMLDFYNYVQERIQEVRGVIFIAMQKCDHILFAYPAVRDICRKQNIKILLVEEEYSFKISERSYIRYEAFKECLELEQLYE